MLCSLRSTLRRRLPVLAAASVLAGGALAVAAEAVKDDGRNYDARPAFNEGFRASVRTSRGSLAGRLALETPDLSLTIEKTTGAVRSLSNHAGYLTLPRPGEEHFSVAMDFVRDNLELLGLEFTDLDSYEVADQVYSDVTGATHIYLRQVHQGIPVYNGQLHVNVNREGRILSVNNLFLPGLARAAQTAEPSLSLAAAVLHAAADASVEVEAEPETLREAAGPQRATSVDHKGISRQRIEGKLMWLPIRAGMARLVWNFQVWTPDKQHAYDYTVDAATGQVWTRIDWTASDQYRVYARPAESPNHVSPVPPADGRTLVTNPADATASPFGWHDTNGAAGAEFNTTEGNNVSAYTDTNADNVPDAGSSPSGGSTRLFDFTLNLGLAPSAYRPAAVTNLFYWNNIVHDIQYRYGFNEAAGNFQVNNYGRGGAGNDSVRAEAQDGSGTNNANFSTPADGSRPRMQMFIWTSPNPDRDGDVDSGIVVHEFGHGISNRLVGGPSNVSCLGNRQQPGEGLSDWWALAYTAKATDTGPMGRGIGTYALGQPITGLGIRTQRYSTDPAVNTWTYASINGMAVPHGVGSVWAQAAWEVYWKLVDAHGFDANLYNATGNAGNQRMMLYVNEGLKNTACSPTFTQVRDGIIQAATDNHSGEDVCRMWEAFAAFGLGTNAVSGGSASTTPTNGFNVPVSCQGGGGLTVFTDDFETDKGWTRNPNATDTATSGLWERGDPQATTSGATTLQVGTTPSGVNALVTARLAGASVGANDVDGGITSIQSPAITLPATGTLTLSFSFYFAHLNNASSGDFFRVKIVGSSTTTVFQELGAATTDAGAYTTQSLSLNSFAGQTIRILIETADNAVGSLIEAGVDDVRITQN